MPNNSHGKVENIFVIGLRNAYALENEALSIMSAQVGRLDKFPALKQRISQHIIETEAQQRRLENILQKFDADYSSFKNAAASIMGKISTLVHSAADDEILKNSFSNFAFENFEIASYISLIAMAEQINAHESITLLEQSLSEEKRMAEWLNDNLKSVTYEYMAQAINKKK